MKYIVLFLLLSYVYACSIIRKDFLGRIANKKRHPQHHPKRSEKTKNFTEHSRETPTKDVTKHTTKVNKVHERRYGQPLTQQKTNLAGSPKHVVMSLSPQLVYRPAARPMVIPVPMPPYHDDELKTLNTLHDVLTIAAMLRPGKLGAHPTISPPPAPPLAPAPAPPLAPAPAPPLAPAPAPPIGPPHIPGYAPPYFPYHHSPLVPGPLPVNWPQIFQGSPPWSIQGNSAGSNQWIPPGSPQASPPGPPQASPPGPPQANQPMGSPTGENNQGKNGQYMSNKCACKEHCYSSCIDDCLFGIIKDFFDEPCCGCCKPRSRRCSSVSSRVSPPAPELSKAGNPPPASPEPIPSRPSISNPRLPAASSPSVSTAVPIPPVLPPRMPGTSSPPLIPGTSSPPLIPGMSSPPLLPAMSSPPLIPGMSSPPLIPGMSSPPLLPAMSSPPLIPGMSSPYPNVALPASFPSAPPASAPSMAAIAGPSYVPPTNFLGAGRPGTQSGQAVNGGPMPQSPIRQTPPSPILPAVKVSPRVEARPPSAALPKPLTPAASQQPAPLSPGKAAAAVSSVPMPNSPPGQPPPAPILPSEGGASSNVPVPVPVPGSSQASPPTTSLGAGLAAIQGGQAVSSGRIPQVPAGQTPPAPVLPQEAREERTDHVANGKKFHSLRKLRKEFRAAFAQAIKSGQRKGSIDRDASEKTARKFHPCPQPPTISHAKKERGRLRARQTSNNESLKNGPCQVSNASGNKRKGD